MTIKFEVGQTYADRSACDHECVFAHTILRRTPKTVAIEVHGKIVTRGIFVYDGVEQIKPYGTYSMCAVLSADRTLARVEGK
jgi:hypothetical protein